MHNGSTQTSPDTVTSNSSSHPSNQTFNDEQLLNYLHLGHDYRPLPSADPITFLQQGQHLKRLPPHLLSSFSAITTPKQRTVITAIRNRRLNYANSRPPELEFDNARDTWTQLWQGEERSKLPERENRDEKAWADAQFLDGERQQVGKLGSLLGMSRCLYAS